MQFRYLESNNRLTTWRVIINVKLTVDFNLRAGGTFFKRF